MEKRVIPSVTNTVLNQLQLDISEIKVALLGNEYNKEGVLYKVAQHDSICKNNSMRIDRILWTAAIVGSIAGFLISLAFALWPIINKI